MERLTETFQILRKARERSASVLVAFSGGKDSLATLDLCKRTFDHVEAFFMYFVPGLRCIEEPITEAAKLYDIKVHRYPHWMLSGMIQDGSYCDQDEWLEDTPTLTLRNLYDLAIADTGIPIIATGARRADSLWRRRNLSNISHYEDLIYPLVGWNKFDVLAYLKDKKIPIPSSSNKNATGVDLSTPSLLWLHDNHHEDYLKLQGVFPYVQAVIERRNMYGVA